MKGKSCDSGQKQRRAATVNLVKKVTRKLRGPKHSAKVDETSNDACDETLNGARGDTSNTG